MLGSWLLKGLLKTRELLSKGKCYQIFNNLAVNVWPEPRIPTLEKFKPKPLHQMNEVHPLLKVSDTIVNNFRSWNIEKMLTPFE